MKLISKRSLALLLIFPFIQNPASSQENLPVVKSDISEIPGFAPAVHGLAVDKGGVIYFSDTYSKIDYVSKVYKLNPPYTGAAIATNISGQSISGLMWQEDRFYVSFLNKNEIHIYDAELQKDEIWYYDGPWNLTSSRKYTFVISYSGEIGVFTRGKIRTIIEDLELPFDIEDTGDNSFWVSEQVGEDKAGRVKLLDYQGEILQEVDYQFENPKGLALDANGNLYIADYGADKIYQVNRSGKVRLVTDKYEEPICVEIRQDGALLVNTNHNGGTLLVIKIKE